jgi:hypothetical protein
MNLISDLTLDRLSFNGSNFACATTLDAYSSILGIPDRSEPIGPPAPYGHRNNVIHYYDQLGLLLREHHSTRLIDGIEFIFEPSKCMFATKHAYSGELTICGVTIDKGTLFPDFALASQIVFRSHLGHAWYRDGERISIQIEVDQLKRKNSAARERILAIAIGFI